MNYSLLRTRGIRLALIAISFLAIFSLNNRSARAELALGGATDVINAPGTEMGTIRYDFRTWHAGGELLFWDGPDLFNGAIIADFNFARWPLNLDFGWLSFDINLGAAYLARTNSITGTLWNFSTRAAINFGDHFRVFIIHISNGRDTFDIARDQANEGWNFVGAALRF